MAGRNLQPVPQNLDPFRTSTTVNVLVGEYNRADRFAPIYATDTGSGTAYTLTPTPGIKFYEIGQTFIFQAANANTGTTPTLNVNGWGAGTITYMDGSALVAGDIAANEWVEVIVTSTTPTFALITVRPSLFYRTTANVVLQKFTTSLGADVSLTSTSNYFDGPSLSLGAGIWLLNGTVTVLDTVTNNNIRAKLWDGTTVVSSTSGLIIGTGNPVSIALSGIITNPVANAKISCKPANTTTGVMKFNITGESKDSTLTAVRIG